MAGDPFTRRKLEWLDRVADDVGTLGRKGMLAFRVAYELLRHLNRATGDAFPGQDRLAQLCGVTNTAVRNALGLLQKRGHLSTTLGNGRGSANRYRPVLKTRKDDCTIPDEKPQPELHLPAEEPATAIAPSEEKGATSEAQKVQRTEAKGASRLATNSFTNPLNEHTEENVRPKKPSKKRSQLPLLRFEEFWSVYPLKAGKAEAHVAYVNAVENGAVESDIIAGAKLYAAAKGGTEKRYIKHASGWLDGRRWQDEHGKANGTAASSASSDPSTWTEETWRSAILVAKRSGRWPRSFGPVTNIPRNLVDSELEGIVGTNITERVHGFGEETV